MGLVIGTALIILGCIAGINYVYDREREKRRIFLSQMMPQYFMADEELIDEYINELIKVIDAGSDDVVLFEYVNELEFRELEYPVGDN